MKRLYRSTKDRMIAGVCGGIAEYFAIDPSLVRIGWVIFSCMGAGALAYIICAVILPNENEIPPQ